MIAQLSMLSMPRALSTVMDLCACVCHARAAAQHDGLQLVNTQSRADTQCREPSVSQSKVWCLAKDGFGRVLTLNHTKLNSTQSCVSNVGQQSQCPDCCRAPHSEPHRVTCQGTRTSLDDMPWKRGCALSLGQLLLCCRGQTSCDSCQVCTSIAQHMPPQHNSSSSSPSAPAPLPCSSSNRGEYLHKPSDMSGLYGHKTRCHA